jgi:hypothetical protein
VYGIENLDSATIYTIVLQFNNNKTTRTRINGINWAKANVLVQKTKSGIMLQNNGELFLVNSTGILQYTGTTKMLQKLIGYTYSNDYLFFDLQTGKLQKTNDCSNWQDIYSDVKLEVALQSFDKRYLLTTHKNDIEIPKDITVIDLQKNQTFEFKDDVNFEYNHFWVKGNTLYVFNSNGFYARLLK